MNRSYMAPILALAIIYTATIPLNMAFRGHLVKSSKEEDMIQRMFGGLRGLVADWAFMKAEEYHHKGLPFLKAMEYHKGESFSSEEVSGHEHSDECEHGHEHDHHLEEGANKDLYSKLYCATHITEDTHLKPAEEKEVLPWFYLEVAFNPHDIRGYTLGGYWLQKMGRRDAALEFLEEGAKKNPRSAMILGSIGWIYFKEEKYAEALPYLDKATRLWLEGNEPNTITNSYQRSDRYFAIDRLGACYEKMGRLEDALKVYDILHELEPTKPLEGKIKRLKG